MIVITKDNNSGEYNSNRQLYKWAEYLIAYNVEQPMVAHVAVGQAAFSSDLLANQQYNWLVTQWYTTLTGHLEVVNAKWEVAWTGSKQSWTILTYAQKVIVVGVCVCVCVCVSVFPVSREP